MLHLSPERLAALADDEPSAVEAVHLAACPACAAERGAQLRLLQLAGAERSATTAPLTSWPGVLAAARADGLVPGSADRDTWAAQPPDQPLAVMRARRPARPDNQLSSASRSSSSTGRCTSVGAGRAS